ncbi:hypothetical protein DVH24_032825 [Malus domestica]|uniref:UBC core domain-containing protein n=1 Tax=Malus domestica TaxID=3750 RepID=A0A498ISW3_MALDO|nr:hypothetical protein DVH24_032825 [Malus domestica]
MAASQASLLLQKQLKDLCKNPVDGFSAGLVDENNIFEWSVTIIGPPDTLYEGGFFNAIMSFPNNYPNSPPTVKFTSEIWHPNVYTDGRVCISILHPPGEDPNGYELASERWTPVHTSYKRDTSGYVAGEILKEERSEKVVQKRNRGGGIRNWQLSEGDGSKIPLLSIELGVADSLEVESIVLSIISMLSSPNDESPANVEAAKEWRDRREDFKKKVSRCVRKSQEML